MDLPLDHCLQSGFHHPVMRLWQEECHLEVSQLIYPIFVTDQHASKTEIPSLPQQYHLSVDMVKEFLSPLIEKGLRSVLIFGVITREYDFEDPTALIKNKEGSCAFSEYSPAIKCIRLLRQCFPQLLVIADVCLCAYTDHGHCGLLKEDGNTLDNERTVAQIAALGLCYAQAGAQVLAPSDMSDGRVSAIRRTLRMHGLSEQIAIMSYAVKAASVFYGPFRDAAHSAPGKGDRRTYQLPAGSRGLSLRAARRDREEGADLLIVKPAGTALDLVREVRADSCLPIVCYQVSGEYAMLWHAAAAGAFQLKDAVLEALRGFRRAGADIIITYYAPLLLDWLREEQQ